MVDIKSKKSLKDAVMEKNDVSLINYVSEKYFQPEDTSAATEAKIQGVIMDHSLYMHNIFSKANEGLSSLDDGKLKAIKLFQTFCDKEEIQSDCK